MMDKARVDQLTETVMAAITDDVRLGVVPWTVTNFGQLHDWADPNMYLEHAGQRYDPDSIDEINAIEDEVSRRLGNGAVTGGWRQVTWTVHQSHSTVLPLALLREEHSHEPLTADNINDETLAEYEGDTTLDTVAGRAIGGVAIADPPAYVEPAARYSGASILDDPRLKLRTALAELRRLDADVQRLGDHDHHDGFENARDEVAEQANGQARVVLQLALTLLGMTQASS